MEYKIYRMMSFAKETHGGNPAGVVFNADTLNEKEMQLIASDIGYSETAFVMKSSHTDFNIRFFTPINEVNLCGHATIATFNLLRDKGIITKGFYTQETKAGILKIEVKDKIVYMEQLPPIYGDLVDPTLIEDCFNTTKIVNTELPIRVLSTGLREIFVPIKGIKELNEIIPDIIKIKNISDKYNVIGIHCFALTHELDIDAYGRNFAPIVGINEESATGTSNGALGCYLNNYVYKDKTNFVLRQGYSMDRPSEILTKLTKRNDEIVTVFVGGGATLIK